MHGLGRSAAHDARRSADENRCLSAALLAEAQHELELKALVLKRASRCSHRLRRRALEPDRALPPLR